jgi:periplasmic protein TonB
MARPKITSQQSPSWFAASVAVHVALVAGSMYLGRSKPAIAAPPLVVELMAPEAPPPAPLPPPEPEPAPPPKAVTKLARFDERPKFEPVPPPPAAAQAGKTLTIDDKDAPPDADAMVQGQHDDYVGGVTTSDGTSSRAVGDGRARGGGGPPPAVRPKVADVDRSAKATLFLTAWNCNHLFPGAATNAGVRHAVVHLFVRVGADGTPLGVKNVDDPGYGFGAAARKCAFQQQFRPARDRVGRPVLGDTALFAVGFHS